MFKYYKNLISFNFQILPEWFSNLDKKEVWDLSKDPEIQSKLKDIRKVIEANPNLSDPGDKKRILEIWLWKEANEIVERDNWIVDKLILKLVQMSHNDEVIRNSIIDKVYSLTDEIKNKTATELIELKRWIEGNLEKYHPLEFQDEVDIAIEYINWERIDTMTDWTKLKLEASKAKWYELIKIALWKFEWLIQTNNINQWKYTESEIDGFIFTLEEIKDLEYPDTSALWSSLLKWHVRNSETSKERAEKLIEELKSIKVKIQESWQSTSWEESDISEDKDVEETPTSEQIKEDIIPPTDSQEIEVIEDVIEKSIAVEVAKSTGTDAGPIATTTSDLQTPSTWKNEQTTSHTETTNFDTPEDIVNSLIASQNAIHEKWEEIYKELNQKANKSSTSSPEQAEDKTNKESTTISSWEIKKVEPIIELKNDRAKIRKNLDWDKKVLKQEKNVNEIESRIVTPYTKRIKKIFEESGIDLNNFTKEDAKWILEQYTNMKYSKKFWTKKEAFVLTAAIQFALWLEDIDWKFWPKTLSAVKKFQKEHNVKWYKSWAAWPITINALLDNKF